MKKIWIHKANTWEEAKKFDENYYLSMSSKERLETMQFLRETYFKMKNESRKGLRRVIKIIQ
ncbi:hypothetical protein KAW65_01950 [candidate division WOR-3 bacterium]|nr:hypothetical protein [candidate division WOR-3 bacterium]